MKMSGLFAALVCLCLVHGSLASWRSAKAKLKADLQVRRQSLGLVNPGDDINNKLIHLEIFFWPIMITQIDEVHQTLSTVSTFVLKWKDHDLAWNISDYDNISYFMEDLNSIWHPIIFIANAANGDSLMLESHLDNVRIDNDGTINYLTAIYLDTLCNLDLTTYPFDQQQCQVLILPFMEDSNYSLTAFSLNSNPPFALSGEWSIINQSLDVFAYKDFQGYDLQTARASLTLERSFTYYIFSIVLPQVFMSLMTPIVFWIPPASGERMSYLVSTFLSMTVFLSYLVGTMPHSMNHPPKLLIFCIVTMAQTFLSILASLVVMSRLETEKARAKFGHRHETLGTEIIGLGLRRVNQVVPSDLDLPPHHQGLNKRCCYGPLTSQRLDTIFFFLYYLLAIPLYIYILFM